MEIVIALIVGLILTVIFAAGVRRTRAWSALFIFFLIVFLTAWAGSLWLTPTGPLIGEVAWVPLLFVGLAVALLLTALIPSGWSPRADENRLENPTGVDAVVAGLGIFYWFVFMLLALGVLIGYLD